MPKSWHSLQQLWGGGNIKLVIFTKASFSHAVKEFKSCAVAEKDWKDK